MMKFTDSHEWIEVVDGIGTVGITLYAQKELGEIVYIELPKIGQYLRTGEEACVLESTKAAVDIYAPLSGKVIESNQELVSNPSLINHSPQGKGWLFRMEVAEPKELQYLLDKDKVD